MTRPDVPTPPSHPPTDAEYVRKLALAILGTLQNKGLLSAAEVDSILIAARRAAQAQPAPAGQNPPAPEQEAPARSVHDITVQPSPPPGTVSWQVVPPPDQAAGGQEQQEEAGPADKEPHPPVIDFKLD